jgi:hypothetical protein
MKPKVTRTVERPAMQAARRTARRQGTSISAISAKPFSEREPRAGFAAEGLEQRQAEGVRPVVPMPDALRLRIPP